MKVIEDTVIDNSKTKVTVDNVSTIEDAINIIKSLAMFTLIELAKIPLESLLKHQIVIGEEYVSVEFPNGDTLEYYIE